MNGFPFKRGGEFGREVQTLTAVPTRPGRTRRETRWGVLAFLRFLPGRCRGPALLVSSFDDQTCRKLILSAELIFD